MQEWDHVLCQHGVFHGEDILEKVCESTLKSTVESPKSNIRAEYIMYMRTPFQAGVSRRMIYASHSYDVVAIRELTSHKDSRMLALGTMLLQNMYARRNRLLLRVSRIEMVLVLEGTGNKEK